ncbi:LppP/LprE family lipoprotein [Streptomyces sp. HB-N217]|nr:LppP/LprE family lipoprotein [Streptomyces sp. HB-N217]
MATATATVPPRTSFSSTETATSAWCPNGPAYSFPKIEAQDGNTVTASVHFAKPDDPVCCPTGETRIYHYEWRNSQLHWTTTPG